MAPVAGSTPMLAGTSNGATVTGNPGDLRLQPDQKITLQLP